MSTSGVHTNEPLNVLPKEAAKELKEFAEIRCLHLAKELKRRRPRLDETDGKSDARHHYNSFKEICEGFLSEPTCKGIKSMLKCAGSYTAKMKKSEQSRMPWNYHGYSTEAENDKQTMDKYYRDVIGKQEISENLANNIRNMGLSAAWWAAYSVFGPEDEKIRTIAQLNKDFERIHGDVNVVNMNFIMNEVRLLSKRPPMVIAEQNFENKGDVEQTMKFSVSVTEGKTRSATHTVNFSYGIGATFSAGFPGAAEMNCQLSFDFSHNHSFQECINKTITKSYEFSVKVPAHDTYIAKAMVEEAEMEIPYELALDFGGGRRSIRGVWKGVACSKAVHTISPVTETPPPPPLPPPPPSPPPETYPCNIF